jgi:hypothetical protein
VESYFVSAAPSCSRHRSISFAREEIEHPKGALVFATGDDSWFWFEAPEQE